MPGGHALVRQGNATDGWSNQTVYNAYVFYPVINKLKTYIF
jgi:hypothetical protein